jgi:hypothetical protein
VDCVELDTEVIGVEAHDDANHAIADGANACVKCHLGVIEGVNLVCFPVSRATSEHVITHKTQVPVEAVGVCDRNLRLKDVASLVVNEMRRGWFVGDKMRGIRATRVKH